MRPVLTRLVLLALALVCGVAGAPVTPAQADGARVQLYSRFPPPYRIAPGWGHGTRLAPHGHGRGFVQRPVIACDAFARCWRLAPSAYGRHGYGYGVPSAPRPPGWADDLPYRARVPDRFVRPDRRVVCDRATAICYKRGEIDKSETEDVFGGRAGDRADDLRDAYGTARLFVPERGVACDRGRRACFDDGAPDHSLTRRYFGRRAAAALD